MKTKDLLRTWEGTQLENKWGRLFIGGLISIIFVLVLMVNSKETVVTIQPFTLESEAWVTKNNASQSYKEAWGLALSMLIGNVQPASVDFIKEIISPILSPGIFQEVLDLLVIQAADIKKDRVIMRFEPRNITYETATNKVFVEGVSFLKAAGEDKERRSNRTYEFIVTISGYMPQLDYIDTYEGIALTEDRLKKKNSKAAKN